MNNQELKPCPHRGEKERDCPCSEYGWNFDEEKGKVYCVRRLTRPPQNWCYVEDVGEIQ